MTAEQIVAGLGAEGQRLDRFLCERSASLGRAAARRLIEAGMVRVNDRKAAPGSRLHAGDRIELRDVPASAAAVAEPSQPLVVAYEDAWLVAVDKPAGTPSHPLRPGELGTLASALVARYPEMAAVGYSPREPGLVHRLDTDTSGLILVARDRETFDALRAQLEQGAIDKRYVALCWGAPAAPAVHEAWLSARGPKVTVRESAFASALRVQTELLDARAIGPWSLVTLRVQHARRHQIRAHLALLAHPIAGDALYGGPALPGLGRHFLHASELCVRHPRTQAQLSIRAPLPAELQMALERIGWSDA
jgi:23S rRNA pseudouridine1911/1915/1917 synthase